VSAVSAVSADGPLQGPPASPEPPAGPADAAAQRLLRERARRLARPPTEEPGAAAGAPAQTVLICRLGAERYAVELRLLAAVQRTTGLLPLPCTPPEVAGVLNVRGEIVTVLDLAALLGGVAPGSEAPAAEETWVLLLDLLLETGPDGRTVATPAGAGAGSVRAGLRVDAALEVTELAAGGLAAPLSTGAYVRGLTADGIALLDLEGLLTGDRVGALTDLS
jgi:chemotaxis signal transduction protein